MSELTKCSNCGHDNNIVRGNHFICENCEASNTYYPGENTYFCLSKQHSTEIKQSNPKDIIGIRKAPLSTVSAPVLAELGVAMLEGALKYGRHNYRVVGVRSSVYYDATIRHLFSWWEGEDIDPDCGLSHITKAITSLVVLRDAMIQGKLEDDRAPRSPEFYRKLNEIAGQMMDKVAGKEVPTHYKIGDESK